MTGEPVFRVGEVAARTGVSVRTLHHYDAIGLLRPSGRTESVHAAGHRRYSVADLARLQQVLSLRQLGFSLDEIADALAQPGFDPLTLVRLHLARANEVLKSQHLLCERLTLLATHLERAEEVSADTFLKTVEATIMAENHFNLPPDQAAALAAHWAKFSPADIEAVQNEWPVLIGRVKEAMAAGTDPRSPQVRALADRATELTRMFSGGNTGVENQLRQKYETDPELQQKTGIDPAVMAYLAKARGE
jgi:DNA-binding transcriptional MerR regulator